MTVIQPGLFLLMQRFPDKKDLLRHRFLNNKSFQSICKDYQRCSDALAYWAKSEQENAPDLYREYCLLLQELETDIIKGLSSGY
jgi:hypothetical protein